MAPQWPLQDFLELGALLGAAPSARLHVRHILWEWGLTRLADPVEHVITELVANAVAAVEDMPKVQPIRIWLLSDNTALRVLVWDASPRLPELAKADDDAEHGRGLTLVQAFSEQWGSYPTLRTGGKIVWAQWG